MQLLKTCSKIVKIFKKQQDHFQNNKDGKTNLSSEPNKSRSRRDFNFYNDAKRVGDFYILGFHGISSAPNFCVTNPASVNK